MALSVLLENGTKSDAEHQLHLASKPSTFAPLVQMYFSSYSYSYSAAFFSALRRARAFIPTPYNRVMGLVGGKHFFYF